MSLFRPTIQDETKNTLDTEHELDQKYIFDDSNYNRLLES